MNKTSSKQPEPFILTSPEKEQDSPTKIRDFHGYHQYLEHYKTGNKTVKRWSFYICGFCFDGKHANVLKSDGSKEAVPIDGKVRILINGKRYGRSYWNH